MTLLLQLAAALYLASGLAGAVSLSIAGVRTGRVALVLMGTAALTHAASFLALHAVDPVPRLTDLPQALSFVALVGAIAFGIFARRGRLAGLTVLLGPLAFLAAFFAALHAPDPGVDVMGGAWPHAHVLLAGSGLALLAVAAVAGGFYLVENRRLKRKQIQASPRSLPSLEALDRINVVTLAVGFPLLTLGVLTGMMWVQGARGSFFTGSAHEAWNGVAWLIYAALVVARFGAHQGARDAAASALAGFAFLLFAVLGVGILA
jgi:ABC-type transport system involved in cytochrome c biogenesis permease subunit